MSNRVKKGDIVFVRTGKSKGKIGKVLKIMRKDGRVVVEGVNLVKKATKANPNENKPGGIIEEPAPLNLSNVMPYCNACHTGVRVKSERSSGKSIRKCAKCSAVLEYK